jgi:hypothetical protein
VFNVQQINFEYFNREKSMKRNYYGWYLPIILIGLFVLSLLGFAGCTSSSGSSSQYYNAGNANLSVTGAQFDQYELFRFDTSTTALTMALPSAADIVNNLSSPYVGEVITFAVAADGSNNVTFIAGTNVTVTPSAQTVVGNTTLTMYCELDNITSGSDAVTIY